MKEVAKYSDWIFYASFLPVVFAAYSAFSGSDLWLASTQWLEVTMVLVLYALYLKHAEK